jgi:hypothetical protein
MKEDLINTFYFDHDYNARTDPKVCAMLSRMDWKGYGIFMAILEILCAQGGYIQREDVGGISFGLSMAQATLEEAFTVFLEVKLLKEDRSQGIYSERILIHLKKREDKHAKAKASGAKGGKKRMTNLKGCLSNPQALLKQEESRVEESRVEKSKEEERKGDEKITPEDENSLIVSIEKIEEILTGQIWQDQVCMAMMFDPAEFKAFTAAWIAKKKVSNSYMYPIAKLRTYLITDFQKTKENGAYTKDSKTKGKTGFRKSVDSL